MLRMLLAGLLCLAAPAVAQDRGLFRFGGDAFASGDAVTLDAAGLDDVFAAGVRVELAAPISGSAHLAGRRVAANAGVGGDLYAAGADVTVAASVAGDASLAGYDVAVEGAVGGDLRAAARHLRVAAPVSGTALLSGGTVALDAAVTGDTALAAEDADFGPDARIGGRLLLYGAAAGLEVPERVAPADRIERHPHERPGPHGPVAVRSRGWLAAGLGFAIGVLVLAVPALLAAVIAPAGLERLGRLIAERPFRTFWIGFLTLSTLIGAVVLAGLTVIGILAAPAILLAAVVLGLVGYIVAVYLLGRLIWGWTGALPPDTFGERALTALIGAVAVSLAALAPFLGWPVALVLTLTGLGALSVAVLRPEFRQ